MTRPFRRRPQAARVASEMAASLSSGYRARMSRPRFVPAVLALAVAVSLAACGSGGGPATTTATETAAHIPTSAARPGDKLALKQIGKFENPVYVAGAPGYPKLLFVVEQPGRIVVLKQG